MYKKKVVIYGIGNLYMELREYIYENYDVIAECDKDEKKSGQTIPLSKALSLDYDLIIVTIFDVKICFEIINMLVHDYNVPCQKINLGINLRQKINWAYFEVFSNKEIICKINEICIAIQNVDEFNNIKEIFSAGCYDYFLPGRDGDIVLDIGTNIGGAALYFANNENVKKVYGFEPFPDTFIQAEKNIALNKNVSKKIELFSYGVSNVNEIRQVLYNKEMTCGQSTDIKANTAARKNYKLWGLTSDKDDMLAQVEVRDIKDILLKIYEAYKTENIILKMDCEGEEYCTMERIDEAGLFERINIIMLEWHYKNCEILHEILKKNRYVYWSFKNENSPGGLIYAVKK